VSIGVIVLRRTRPDLPRAFRCPGVPWVPALAVLSSVYLMLNLPALTWERFLIWMAIGMVVYYLYGRQHSRLATAAETGYNTDAYGGEAAELAGRGTGGPDRG
jgi:APA family basic amino acid/polyamine antiporter